MQLGITILCVLIIVVLIIQLYRTYSWQKLINNKQSDYVEAHVKSNTKPYLSALATSFAFMIVVNLPITSNLIGLNNSKSGNSLEMTLMAEASNDYYDATESNDLIMNYEYEEEKVVGSIASTSVSNDCFQPNHLLASFSRNDSSFKYIILKINETATDYSDDELLDYLELKELIPSDETFEEADYELIITNSDNVVETYLLKEYDDCFIACDDYFGFCYYIKK